MKWRMILGAALITAGLGGTYLRHDIAQSQSIQRFEVDLTEMSRQIYPVDPDGLASISRSDKHVVVVVNTVPGTEVRDDAVARTRPVLQWLSQHIPADRITTVVRMVGEVPMKLPHETVTTWRSRLAGTVGVVVTSSPEDVR